MIQINRRQILLATAASIAALGGCASATGDPVARKRLIDSAADQVLAKLYQEESESKTVASKARGILIFPEVRSAGLVVGGGYGEGVLRVLRRPVEYYDLREGSLGLVAGAESRAVFVMFMTDEALQKFQASRGWTAGADASVTMADKNFGTWTDTLVAQRPVVGYVLSLKGLMANVKIDGAKIGRLNL